MNRKRPPSLVWSGLLLLAGLLFSPSARAAGAGTSAATFLELGYGARPIGLGEAFVAVADDVSALHYNPAGLAFAAPDRFGTAPGRYEMLASHSILIQDLQLTQMGLVARPFGVSFTHLAFGKLEQRTAETASPDGTFGAADDALALTAGRMVGPVGVGVTGRYVHETIGGASASAYVLDFGALHRLERYPVSFGLQVANAGTKVRFIDQAYPLPETIRVGAAYGMTRSFPHTISLQLELPRDGAPVARLGFEYLGFGPISLRMGYRTFGGEQRSAALGKQLGTTASGLSEFYGMFIGAGLRSSFGTLDYALVPYGELGTAHRLSFTFAFGQPLSGANHR